MLAGILPLLLALALPPAQQDIPITPGKDTIALRSGGYVDGIIVEENDTIIAIEVLPGARVEFAKSDVASVKRAERKTESAPASRPAGVELAAEPIADHWFLVRNAMGELLGTRRVRVAPDTTNPGGLRIEETLSLKDEAGKPIKIQRIETAERDLRPRECHYREVSEGASSTVEARINGDTLVVETLDDDGRSRVEIPHIGKLTFPLLFREVARRMPPASGSALESDVYDPFVRTIARRAMKGSPNQTIAIGNETPRSHRVCVAFARGIESVVWFAAPGDVAREELNGPDLVAVRCTPEEAQTTKVERSQEPFTARDASGRIQLLLPTADWKFEKPLAEAVALARKDGCASIVTFILDAEKDVTTTGTALLLERRLSHTLQRYQRNGGYDDTTVGKLPAIRFDFQCQETKGTRSGIAFTIRGPNAAAACVMTFETSEKGAVERELDRMLNRADFRL